MGDFSVKDQERLRAVERFQWITTGVSTVWLTILTVVTPFVLVGGCNLSTTVAELKTSLTGQEKSLTEAKIQIEKSHNRDFESLRLEQKNGVDGLRLQQKDNVDRLEKLIQARLTRTAVNEVKMPGGDFEYYHSHYGKIGRISADSVTLDYSAEGNIKVEWTFALARGARMLIEGKEAKLEELKPGMFVVVVHHDGNKVELMNAVKPAPPAAQPPVVVPAPK